MSCSGNVLVTIDTKGAPEFMAPVVMTGGPVTRQSTVLHLIAADNGVSLLGTYDEILDYVAEITNTLFNWALQPSLANWFGEDDDLVDGEVSGSGN